MTIPQRLHTTIHTFCPDMWDGYFGACADFLAAHPAVKAKIDTGARTSALHIQFVEEFEQEGRPMVRFGVQPIRRRTDIERLCQAPVLDRRQVKNSGGYVEERYVIRTDVTLGPCQWTMDLSLTCREKMLFRMLLGRKAVENRFLIDSGKAYLTGRSLANAYKTNTRNR